MTGIDARQNRLPFATRDRSSGSNAGAGGGSSRTWLRSLRAHHVVAQALANQRSGSHDNDAVTKQAHHPGPRGLPPPSNKQEASLRATRQPRAAG
jgi:hypothetical protein